MKYYITKDCGTGWDTCIGTEATSWGVSASQRQLAQNVATGDVLLHFIDRVRAWAGYSVVSGPMEDNDDPVEEFREALPSKIPIQRGVWLQMNQCQATRNIKNLPATKFYRRRAFTAVEPNEAETIMQAISSAQSETPPIDDEFKTLWNVGADGYWWQIARAVSGGACWLCKDTVDSWIKRTNVSLTKDEIQLVRHRFLDVAHIRARSVGGPITPDNVRVLCPSCHRIVDRLSPERCIELLTSK